LDYRIAGGCADHRQMIVIGRQDGIGRAGKHAVRIVSAIHVCRQRELANAALAGRAAGALFGPGQGRQQKRRKNGNNGDDDKQFDQGEGAAFARRQVRAKE
jgi:hypothetical protein